MNEQHSINTFKIMCVVFSVVFVAYGLKCTHTYLLEQCYIVVNFLKQNWCRRNHYRGSFYAVIMDVVYIHFKLAVLRDKVVYVMIYYLLYTLGRAAIRFKASGVKGIIDHQR